MFVLHTNRYNTYGQAVCTTFLCRAAMCSSAQQVCTSDHPHAGPTQRRTFWEWGNPARAPKHTQGNYVPALFWLEYVDMSE